MYKSRFFLWLMVAILCIGCSSIWNKYDADIKNYIEEKQNSPKSATVFSDVQKIRQSLNDESIKGIKLQTVNGDADILIVKGDEVKDGYDVFDFYSPIIAVTSNNNGSMFKKIESTINYTINGIDLKYVMQGFSEDKTYKECYPGADDSSSSFAKKQILLCVDTRYEKEIKATMLMAMAGKCDITDEDAKKYMPFINTVWDKAEKIDSSDVLGKSDLKNKIFLTAEWEVIFDSGLEKLYMGNTVAKKYTVGCKEEFSDIVKGPKFMRKLGIRRADAVNFRKSPFGSVAYTPIYIYDTDIEVDLGSYTARSNLNNNLENNVSETSLKQSQGTNTDESLKLNTDSLEVSHTGDTRPGHIDVSLNTDTADAKELGFGTMDSLLKTAGGKTPIKFVNPSVNYSTSATNETKGNETAVEAKENSESLSQKNKQETEVEKDFFMAFCEPLMSLASLIAGVMITTQLISFMIKFLIPHNKSK